MATLGRPAFYQALHVFRQALHIEWRVSKLPLRLLYSIVWQERGLAQASGCVWFRIGAGCGVGYGFGKKDKIFLRPRAFSNRALETEVMFSSILDSRASLAAGLRAAILPSHEYSFGSV